MQTISNDNIVCQLLKYISVPSINVQFKGHKWNRGIHTLLQTGENGVGYFKVHFL